MKGNNWFVYIVRCRDNSLYTGVTTNIERRILQHNGAIKGGAKYTRNKGPVQLEYLEEQEDRSAAQRREYEIKQFSKKEKEKLVENYINLLHKRSECL